MDTAILDRPKGERTERVTKQVVVVDGATYVASATVAHFSYRRGRPPRMRCQPGTLPPDHEWGHKDGCD